MELSGFARRISPTVELYYSTLPDGGVVVSDGKFLTAIYNSLTEGARERNNPTSAALELVKVLGKTYTSYNLYYSHMKLSFASDAKLTINNSVVQLCRCCYASGITVKPVGNLALEFIDVNGNSFSEQEFTLESFLKDNNFTQSFPNYAYS